MIAASTVAYGLLAEVLNRRFGVRLFTLELWGSVADWAGAVLPTSAILVTVALWLLDRSARMLSETRRDLARVEIDDARGDPRYVHNDSGRDWFLLRIEGEPIDALLRNGASFPVPRKWDLFERLAIEMEDDAGNLWILQQGALPRLV